MLIEASQSMLVLVDVQEKLTPLVMDSELLVSRCRWLLSLARDLSIPHIVCEQYPRGLGHTVPLLQGFSAPYAKVHFSCFADPVIRQQIETLQRTQILLMGIETHVCVLQTALQLQQAGYSVFVVQDAVRARCVADHRCGLDRMLHAGIHLVTSEMVFFECLRAAGTDQFKQLSMTYLKNNT